MLIIVFEYISFRLEARIIIQDINQTNKLKLISKCQTQQKLNIQARHANLHVGIVTKQFQAQGLAF